MRGNGFGVFGGGGTRPGGICPQGDAWEIPKGVLRPLGTARAHRGDGNVLVTLKSVAIAQLLPRRCGAGRRNASPWWCDGDLRGWRRFPGAARVRFGSQHPLQTLNGDEQHSPAAHPMQGRGKNPTRAGLGGEAVKPSKPLELHEAWLSSGKVPRRRFPWGTATTPSFLFSLCCWS